MKKHRVHVIRGNLQLLIVPGTYFGSSTVTLKADNSGGCRAVENDSLDASFVSLMLVGPFV